MKITKRQLRKIIEEEIKKVYEIGSSGRSAWDPTNAKEREKEVYRLGKDKIARLRAAAKEDQEDRAKSPRFGKAAKEDPTQLKETTGDRFLTDFEHEYGVGLNPQEIAATMAFVEDGDDTGFMTAYRKDQNGHNVTPFDIFYSYYQYDMPYGVQKARTGDPYEWIVDRIADELGI